MDADDLVLISVDDHVIEPRDMFDAHVPVRWRDAAPRVHEDRHGREYWWYGDMRGRTMGLNATAGRPLAEYAWDAYRYDEMRPGCYDPAARVADMDTGGVLASLNFPNFPGFAGQVLNFGGDAATNDVMIKAYNDWMLADWCGRFPDRFIPCGIVPYFDVACAAAEVRRLAGLGCHAITFLERPEVTGAPSLHSDEWDPFFEACEEEQTIICVHLGSSGLAVTLPPDRPFLVRANLTPMTSMVALVDLLWAPFWFRFPGVKISLTEGDIGWMPYVIQRAEHSIGKYRESTWATHHYPKESSPEQIFRERILCCFIDDRVGVGALDSFNVDNISWEHDYPHSDGVWPHGPEVVARVVAGLDDETIAKITHRNAMRHYQFDPFQWRPRQQATAGALRAGAAVRAQVEVRG